MAETTTIQVQKSVIKELKKVKAPKQTYTELLRELCRVFKGVKEKKELDEFVQQAQQEKMKELWGNEADKVWEHI